MPGMNNEFTFLFYSKDSVDETNLYYSHNKHE